MVSDEIHTEMLSELQPKESLVYILGNISVSVNSAHILKKTRLHTKAIDAEKHSYESDCFFSDIKC